MPNLYFSFFPRGVGFWLTASVTVVVFAGRYSMAVDKCEKMHQMKCSAMVLLQNKAQKGNYMDEIPIFHI